MFFLDQSGFAPTLPIGYSWARAGQRKTVAYEPPQRRRVNVVGALSSERDRLLFECRPKSEGRYDGDAHLRFVRKIQGQIAQERFRSRRPQRPLWIVLDNYSVHHCGAVNDEGAALATEGIAFLGEQQKVGGRSSLRPLVCPFSVPSIGLEKS